MRLNLRLLGLNWGGLRQTGRLDGLNGLGGSRGTRGGRSTGPGCRCLGLGLLSAKDALQARGLVCGTSVLLLLKFSKAASLSVDILQLLLTLVVCEIENVSSNHSYVV